jgi:hypothetical protein
MPFTSFGTPSEKREFTSNFKKTQFVDMNGTSIVRVLTKNRLEIETHYINRATVQCLGEDCPVCANNKAIIMQFPETFREEAKYSPRRIVKLVNVLDKTLVRVCPKCSTEIPTLKGAAPATCKCGEILTGDAVSSMKVKVLSRGVALFDQLDAINNAILDVSGEPVGLTGYDITFVVSGTGKNKVITPIAGQISEAPVVDEKELYDLESVTMKLTATEMVDLQRGVSLKDIFSARKANEKLSTLADSVISEDIMKEVNADVSALFGQKK